MRFLLAAFLVVSVFCAGLSAQTYDQVGKVKTYGKAMVASLGSVEGVYCFRCDIKGWPDIIGKDIPVRIGGIELPAIVTEYGKSNKFFELQVKKILSQHLKQAQTIKLENIQRGKDFCLIAEVTVDSNSLGEILFCLRVFE